MTTTQQPHPHPSGAARRPRSLRRAIGTAVVCGIAVGAVAAVSWATRSDGAHEATVTERVDTIDIDVRAGDVEVIASDRDDIAISWRARSGLTADATVTHQVTGSTLTVVGECDRTLWFGNCSTDIVLHVPEHVDVVATTDAGDLTAAGLTGDADLKSSAGTIRAEDHAGDLVAHSDAGAVIADGLLADSATVTSDAGAITVDALLPPHTVVAESSAGKVTVILPDDGRAYDVRAHSDAGRTVVDVPTDPDSEHVVTATSEAGEVVVTVP